MALLSEDVIQVELASMDRWTYSNNEIYKDISFQSYMAGIGFVNQLAEIAEAKNHHPGLTVGWCNVGVTFTSHDQGGMTSECIAMAKTVNVIL
ncbi:MAG: 4a-hydroxytetrahydrobiopterin dehydratase [Candidatus Marinimicrobia bacterium]|jgi:4a-hydroxytetrahydrobiopterin dehydratase|nr:4a-hydroxytetrahydrobiopterin dehydratase [Candidatus Neomarinimicrobiota bacterium]MDP6611244.1 4a-hydroxytetrahydrobiopterin dehydratase [Candidatus Neomarinimicrobiota bacterium]|tara:strand:+ start:22891 stop:23169 length:279 start_codon:yes stop_codon:yes gene_type:complete